VKEEFNKNMESLQKRSDGNPETISLFKSNKKI
jgi:hypothetical protein